LGKNIRLFSFSAKRLFFTKILVPLGDSLKRCNRWVREPEPTGWQWIRPTVKSGDRCTDADNAVGGSISCRLGSGSSGGWHAILAKSLYEIH
jgi:hypothetical protein